ncbi:MAG: class I SAM-dependent methyltransferase [Bacteroidales bacterium]|jgi:ubiquinone/menaquinone biosynthesis C-methylase UbiE|nr:class I SAM-dependent methyltransferase [Bacteroidales bacterium]
MKVEKNKEKKPSPTEFDSMADGFDNLVKEGLGIFAVYREGILNYKLEYLKRLVPYTPKSILEYGCGVGLYIPYLKECFPNAEIYGCDVSPESIRQVSENIPDCHFDLIEVPEDLKVYEGKIDCVFVNCVLHHIPPEEHKQWLTALYTYMKKDTYLVIFEMNMYNPLSRWFVKRTPIDDNATMLTPKYCKTLIRDIFGKDKKTKVKLKYTYFFPWRNKVFKTIEYQLTWIPLGAQYCVVVKK